MLRNIIILVLGSLIVPRFCYASDGAQIANNVLTAVIIMIGIAAVGIIANVVISAFGDGRLGNIIKNTAYLGCVAVFVGVAGIILYELVGFVHTVRAMVS